MATLVLAAVGAGCGDDDDGGDGRDGGLDGGPRSGTTGGGGRSGSGGNNSGTAGTTPRAGSMAPVVMCDEDIEAETSCGDTTCPALPQNAPMCTISCCVDDKCGTQNTGAMGARACEELAEPDTRCPNYDGASTGGGNIMLPGCCTPSGDCGVISSRSGTCITQSPFIMLPADPQRCDGTDGDAGADLDGG